MMMWSKRERLAALISDASPSKENGSDRGKTKEERKKAIKERCPLDEMPNHKGEDTSNKTEITLSSLFAAAAVILLWSCPSAPIDDDVKQTISVLFYCLIFFEDDDFKGRAYSFPDALSICRVYEIVCIVPKASVPEGEDYILFGGALPCSRRRQ